jgi:hypothetical protein
MSNASLLALTFFASFDRFDEPGDNAWENRAVGILLIGCKEWLSLIHGWIYAIIGW